MAGLLIALAVAAALPAVTHAQTPATDTPSRAATGRPPTANRVFQVRRAAEPVRIDARLDDPAWRDADVVPLPIEIEPRDNVPADLATECRITYDERNLYLGCEAFDPDPASIRAFITNRDGIFGNHDRISFLVDPFNDSRRGFVFEVSAVGVQADLVYDERTDFDASWDGIWTSAGRITDRGFVIEAAIPFRTLRFPSTAEVQTWRFWINRMRPRSEFVILRSNTRIRGEACQLCQANLLHGFQGIDPGVNAELVPTLTGRYSASRDERFPDGALAGGSPRFEPGLDARWSVTSNLSLNATVNPDFSQIEADAPQLDVNAAFALRFPEKRPFFLEGADLFATPIEVVFTRTVADPVAGVKLTGKAGRHAIGVLAALDEVNTLVFPGPFGSSDAGIDERVASTVLRYRRDVGENNTIGAIYTGRFAGSDYRNQVAGLDAYLQPAATLSISAQALASESRYDRATAEANAQPLDVFSGQAVRTHVVYRDRAWFADLTAHLRTEGFRADAGFVPQTDYRGAVLSVGRDFRSGGGVFTLIQPNAGVWRNERMTGSLINEGYWLTLFYEGPWQSTAWFNPEWRRAAFGDETHDLLAYWAGVDLRPLPSLQLGVSGNVGDAIDFRNGGEGRVVSVSPSLAWQLGRRTELGSSHSVQRLEKAGVEVFTARIDEVRGVFNLDTRAFVRAILQYRRTERNPATNPGLVRSMEETLLGQLLISYKVNPLTVAFLGVSDDRLGFEEGDGSRVELTPRGRTVFFKLGYAWRP